MNSHDELNDVDHRIADVDADIKQLRVDELNARREVESATMGDDPTLFTMLSERVTIIENKLKFLLKQSHLLLKDRQPLVAEVNRLDAQAYSKAQAELRAELTKQVAAEKAQLERNLTQFIAKMAYSQGSFAGSISLDRVFSDTKKGADPIISNYKREGIR